MAKSQDCMAVSNLESPRSTDAERCFDRSLGPSIISRYDGKMVSKKAKEKTSTEELNMYIRSEGFKHLNLCLYTTTRSTTKLITFFRRQSASAYDIRKDRLARRPTMMTLASTLMQQSSPGQISTSSSDSSKITRRLGPEMPMTRPVLRRIPQQDHCKERRFHILLDLRFLLWLLQVLMP